MHPEPKLKEMCRPFLDETMSRQPVARLWRREHSLWKPSPREISNRLGWLDLPRTMSRQVNDLKNFAEEARPRGFRNVVLLGMGGSSLCGEVLRQTFANSRSAPHLHVLDSTVPAWVRRTASSVDPEHTLFIVASKSGGTIEVLSLYHYFRHLVEAVKGDDAGENFVAITDAGSGLEKLAKTSGFLRVFLNPADVGGRYSALSLFGLVPAALMGLEIRELLSRAREKARACGVETPVEENPGAWLGMVMGCMARTGRDKLTLVTSPSIRSFGLWAEQLLAESTGKEGHGIVPIADEPFGPPDVYGDDRLFVYLRLKDDDNEITDRHVHVLHESGLPVIKADLRDAYDIGGEFFRWEFAAAMAGACLQINPFDEPNVQESKQITSDVLAEYAAQNALPPMKNEGDFAGLIAKAKKGDYIAFMAFTEDTPELTRAMADLRGALLNKRKLPSTFGYGPRFLHSTGQLHKGGANNGLYVQITAESAKDEAIPGQAYSFGTLASAQALGDFDALKKHGRRVIRLHVPKGRSIAKRVKGLIKAV